jgi:hypothetical protein
VITPAVEQLRAEASGDVVAISGLDVIASSLGTSELFGRWCEG